MKTAYTIILYIITALNVHAESSKMVVDSFVEKVRQKVPEGWDTSYNKKDKAIEISRKKKVKGSNSLPYNLGTYNEPEKVVSMRMMISVQIFDEFTSAEYRKLHDENNAIIKNLLKIENELEKKSIRRGRDGIYDIDRVSEVDLKIINEYNTISKKLQKLPEYFYESIGLDIDGNWEGATIQFIIKDEAIMDECTRAKDIVIGMAQKF